jgi:transposase
MTDRDRQHLKRHVKANRGHRRQPLSDITATLNLNVSDDTLCNELQKLNLNRRVACKKPWLRPAQKLARLEFEKKYRDWDFEEWSRCIWTDEMAMQTASNGGKVYVWREPDEEYNEDCIEPTFIPRFKRVKVWGAVRYGKKSKLVVIPENIEKGKKLDAETYMTEIMDKELFDFWQEAMEECGHVYVMEDGAPPHQGVASVRRKELEKVGWKGWGPGTWPSSSPDLNPIENIWRMLKCAVRKRDPLPRTEAQLTEAMVEEWERLDMDKINKILLTMRDRLAAVKKAHGAAIPY